MKKIIESDLIPTADPDPAPAPDPIPAADPDPAPAPDPIPAADPDPVVVQVYEKPVELEDQPEAPRSHKKGRGRGRPRTRPVEKIPAGGAIPASTALAPDALGIVLLANAELLGGAIARVEISLAAKFLGLSPDTSDRDLALAWRAFLEAEGQLKLTPGEQLLVMHLITFGPPLLIHYLTPKGEANADQRG